MQNILGHYVFDPARGWLQDDEKTWSHVFDGAAEFKSADLANDIGFRQSPKHHQSFYVFACLGSMEPSA